MTADAAMAAGSSGDTLYLGIDFGTSGARAIAIDGAEVACLTAARTPQAEDCCCMRVSQDTTPAAEDVDRRERKSADSGKVAAQASQRYAEAGAEGWAATWERCG